MFNVGGAELLVICLVALIVLGPQRLPGAARQVGKVMGDLRRISSGFQNELKNAFDEEPPRRTEPVPLARAVADEEAKAGDPAGVDPAPPTSESPPEAQARSQSPTDSTEPRPLRRVETPADDPSGLAPPVADALDEILASAATAAASPPAPTTTAEAAPDGGPAGLVPPEVAATRVAGPHGTGGVGDAGGPAGGHRAAS